MTPLSIGKPGHFYYEIFTNNLGGIISDTTLNDILRISKCCGFKPLNFSIQLSAVAGEWNHLQLHILQWIQSWMCDPSVTEFMVLYMSDSLWVTANIPLSDAFSEEQSSWNFTNSLPGRIEIFIVFTESRLSTWQLQHV